jgi:hypothetical protein
VQSKFCINHPTRKVRAKGLCGSCYNKEFYKLNPDKYKIKCENGRKIWKKIMTPEKNRARQLKNRYGITIEEYNKILFDQNNGCAICGKETAYNNGEKRLHVDHCHTTGRIRGLLCSQCNTTLGHLEKLGFDKIMEYLNKEKMENE